MKIKQHKGETVKNTEIFYIREGSVLGAELFLINSKPIHTIINNHAAVHGQPEIKEEENEDDEEDDF